MKLIPHIRNVLFPKFCNLFVSQSKQVLPSRTKPTETVILYLIYNSVLIFNVSESIPNQMKGNWNFQSISRTYCIRLNPVDTQYIQHRNVHLI